VDVDNFKRSRRAGASIVGGFFAIAKPPAAILPRTGRKLFTKREAT
jgi:hypothetical protein